MDRPLVLATAVAALVVVGVPAIWRYARTMITIVHEGGHALVAVLTGRRLRGIRLHSDTSGLTVARGKPRGLGMVATLMAGYLAPSLIGLAAVFPLAAGRITLMLWITLALLFLVLIMIRNWFGLFAVLVVGAGVYAVTRYASFDTQTIVASLGVWFLLIGGVKPLFELTGRRLRSSDPAQLASVTGVPALFWLALMILVNGACLAYGAWLMLA